jgi:RNA polymerase sigma factor (sigma-70 family)
MTESSRADEAALRQYAGLVFSTARLYVGVVEDEFEDIQQILWIKVWKARAAYNPDRSSMSEKNYVFSCVKNQCKDLVKQSARRRKARADAMASGYGVPAQALDSDTIAQRLPEAQPSSDLNIEQVAADVSSASLDTPVSGRDSFEGRYLRTDRDEVYGEIERDEIIVPSTLTAAERAVLALLYADYSQVEAAVRLGMSKREVERAVSAIREKMADWSPGTADATVVRAAA